MCVASATPSDTRRAHVRHPTWSQQRLVRDVNDHSQSKLSDAPMATDGDRHTDDGDGECDQLNRTNDREPDDDMSNDDDDADRDVNDHNEDDDDVLLHRT
jgi:hypothetical protein